MSKIKAFLALPKSVTIKPSELHGLGLFATEDIEKGVKLGISHFEDKDAKNGMVRTPLGGFLNHSSDPNAGVIDGQKQWVLVTVKPIKKGEELTVDYTPWYEPEVIKTYN